MHAFVWQTRRVTFLKVSGGQALGDRVLRPFLQDTVRWWPLTVTMAGTLLAAPITIARVLAQARVPETWLRPASPPAHADHIVRCRSCNQELPWMCHAHLPSAPSIRNAHVSRYVQMWNLCGSCLTTHEH